MIDFYTDWCGWCKRLDRDVYAKSKIQEKLSKYVVPVKLNPEKGGINYSLARKHGVHGYPTVVFLDSDGKKVESIGGYVPAERFGEILDKIIQRLKITGAPK